MGFFKKKHEIVVALPTIPASAIGRMEVQAVQLARGIVEFRNIVESISGLREYGTRVLPKIAPMVMMGNFEGAFKLLLVDPVIGPALSELVISVKKELTK